MLPYNFCLSYANFNMLPHVTVIFYCKGKPILFLTENDGNMWCKVFMTFLFVAKLFYLVRWRSWKSWKHFKQAAISYMSSFGIWWENSNILPMLSIIPVSCSSLKPEAPTHSMGHSPVAKMGKVLERRMCRSVARTFLGWLNLQGTTSSKFNSSCQAINSFDKWELLM